MFKIYTVIFLLASVTCVADEWNLTTSGPMLTDTAESMELGSWSYEPYLFNYRTSDPTKNYLQAQQELNIGIGRGFELDTTAQYLSTATDSGLGDTSINIKKSLIYDADTHSFLAMPSLTLKAGIGLPTGGLDGADHTYGELKLIARKRFEPFEIYFDSGLKTYNNYKFMDIAFEHVLDQSNGFGYVLEVTSAFTTKGSYAQVGPILEINGPSLSKRADVSWGLGVFVPVWEHDYPAYITPTGTITFSFH